MEVINVKVQPDGTVMLVPDNNSESDAEQQQNEAMDVQEDEYSSAAEAQNINENSDDDDDDDDDVVSDGDDNHDQDSEKQEETDNQDECVELCSGMILTVRGESCVLKMDDGKLKAYPIRKEQTRPGNASSLLKKIIEQAGVVSKEAGTPVIREGSLKKKGKIIKDITSKTVYVDGQGLYYNDPRGQDLFMDNTMYEDPTTGQMFLDQQLTIPVSVQSVQQPTQGEPEYYNAISHVQTLYLIEYIRKVVRLDSNPAASFEDLEFRVRKCKGSKKILFGDLTEELNKTFGCDHDKDKLYRKWTTLIKAAKLASGKPKSCKSKFKYYNEMENLLTNRLENVKLVQKRKLYASAPDPSESGQPTNTNDFQESLLEQMKQTNQNMGKFFEMLPVLFQRQ